MRREAGAGGRRAAQPSPDTRMEKGCVFCDIAAGKLPADMVYSDERVIMVKDIHPRAPVHHLVIPRAHIPTLNEALPEHKELLGHMVYVATEQAKKEGLAPRGYRLVVNCGQEGGQLVPHLHLHLLGGRRLSAAIG